VVEVWVAPLRSADVRVAVDVDRDIHPAAALARVAARHPGALVVVGGRPLGAITGVRRGRVPLKVVHDTGVPVVVVPATEDPGGTS
jgi:nucleotide-binding universal stress UspA family protein